MLQSASGTLQADEDDNNTKGRHNTYSGNDDDDDDEDVVADHAGADENDDYVENEYHTIRQ